MKGQLPSVHQWQHDVLGGLYHAPCSPVSACSIVSTPCSIVLSAELCASPPPQAGQTTTPGAKPSRVLQHVASASPFDPNGCHATATTPVGVAGGQQQQPSRPSTNTSSQPPAAAAASRRSRKQGRTVHQPLPPQQQQQAAQQQHGRQLQQGPGRMLPGPPTQQQGQQCSAQQHAVPAPSSNRQQAGDASTTTTTTEEEEEESSSSEETTSSEEVSDSSSSSSRGEGRGGCKEERSREGHVAAYGAGLQVSTCGPQAAAQPSQLTLPDFAALPPLRRPLTKGDVVGYRVVEITPQCCPQVRKQGPFSRGNGMSDGVGGLAMKSNASC